MYKTKLCVCVQSHVVLCQLKWVRSGRWSPSVSLLRRIHKHTQILHSANRTRQLPTLRRVSSLNTISCQLCAEQTRVMTRVHEAVLPSLSLTLIQLLSTMHPGSSSYKIPAVQLMSVCTIFFSSRDLLFVLIALKQVQSDFALCSILSDVSGPQLYIIQQGMQ